MNTQELTHVETRVKELSQSLAQLANDVDLQEFLRIIHKPGWTSVAELAFANALIEGMHGHANMLATLKTGLLTGSRAVSAK